MPTVPKGVGMVRKSQTLVAAIAASLAVPAIAQTDNASGDDAIEEIVVTGSRLPRRDFTAPSPIASMDQEAAALTQHPAELASDLLGRIGAHRRET